MAWGTKKNLEDVKCSLIGGVRVNIYPVPKRKIEILMAEYLHTEWVGYLVGERQDCPDLGLTNFDVKDIIIRLHEESSGGTCLAEPALKQGKDWIGAIHSHHGMGAFHSGQDDHTVDRNFDISITVAKKSTNLEYDAISHVTTPCGKHSLLKCSVKYVQPKPMFDRKKWLSEAKENIDKGTRTKVVKIPDNYVPMRYRKEDSYVVDGAGRVLSAREYQDIMAGIWKD